MALPNFQAAGERVAGQHSITVAWPAHQAGDIGLLILESQTAVTPSLFTPEGFVAVTGSPLNYGTTAKTTLSVWWCRATTDAMGSPVVVTSGDHNIAVILTFRGCIASGDPWNVIATNGIADSINQSLTLPGATTTVAECLVAVVAADSFGSISTTRYVDWANADLASLTERWDNGTTFGDGGGLGVATGGKASAGLFGSTTVTFFTGATPISKAYMTIALKPPVDEATHGWSSQIYSVAATLAALLAEQVAV